MTARLPFLLALLATLGSTGLAAAQPACGDARVKIAEAGALRYQARQEAFDRNRGRVCDTLDEAADRYEGARDLLDECGQTVLAISLRSELRDVRHMKRAFACD